MLSKKLFLFLSVAAILASCYAEVPACSTDEQNEDDYAEIHADPDNCGAYYECANGVAYEEFCPDGLLFNIDLQVCDYANHVDCGTRPVTPIPITEPTTIDSVDVY